MSKVLFGHAHTDNMLDIDYTDENGWEKPVIKPFENL